MTPDPDKKQYFMNASILTNPELAVEELKRRTEAAKEQVQRLEEAKIVKQETMQIEVSI